MLFTLALQGGGLLMDKIMAWGLEGDSADWSTGTVTISTSPVPGPSLPYEIVGIRQLAAGFLHNLVLLDDKHKTVWAWGDNYFGQLGNNSTQSSRKLVQVAGLKDVVEIAAGLWHNLARTESGDLWAWGYNFWGQLGTGDRRPRLVPVQLGFKDATAIAAGAHHSLAVMTTSETGLFAWGANLDGQLGPGTKDDHSPLPVLVFATPKGTIPTYQKVAAGLDHSLALRSDGVVMAWGRNLSGQLGDGTTQGRPDPAEVKPPLPRGQGAILEIAAGGGFSFARASGVPADKDAGVWAWGFNGRGELGDGTTKISQPLPVRVVGPGGKGILTKVSAIAAGIRGTSLALGADGTVLAWGYNVCGELGNGTRAPSNVPLQVDFGPKTTAAIGHIAAGFCHSLAAGLILP